MIIIPIDAKHKIPAICHYRLLLYQYLFMAQQNFVLSDDVVVHYIEKQASKKARTADADIEKWVNLIMSKDRFTMMLKVQYNIG